MKKVVYVLFVFCVSSILKAQQFSEFHDVSQSIVNAKVIKSADIDGDGIVDLISGSTQQVSLTYFDKIAWHRNTGNGNFEAPVIITIDEELDDLRDIHVSDLDNDGDIDIVGSSRIDKKVFWYENTGEGVFSAQHVVSNNANYAVSVFASDLDGDGDQEILAMSSLDDELIWYENLGNALFSSGDTITTQTDGPSSVYTSDLDGDGDQDILSTSGQDDKVAWYENLGGGSFSAQNVISTSADGAKDVYTADLDGDGDQDVIVSSIISDEITWYENMGNDTFELASTISSFPNLSSFYFGDLDNDSDIDVVSVQDWSSPGIIWHINDGNGDFSDYDVVTVNNIADKYNYVHVADITGDGKLDLMTGSELNNDNLFWHKNLGNDNFSSRKDIAIKPNGIKSIFSSDLDNDGDMDLLSASSFDDRIAWYENMGYNNFSTAKTISVGNREAEVVIAADLDGDSLDDVISMADFDNDLYWHQNLGNGNFSSQMIISDEADNVNNIHASDLDNDGDIDLLAIGNTSLFWYKNLGSGNFSAEDTIATTFNGGRSITTADIDTDGDLDILAASAFDDKVVWFENLGGDTFSIENVISTTVDWPQDVYSSDLDQDGDPDVLVASSGDESIRWFENLGNDTFALEVVVSSTVLDAISVVTSDIDQDGDIDIISAGSLNNKVFWHENTGAEVFAEKQTISEHASVVRDVLVSDLDGDGDDDVVWAAWWMDRVAWNENLQISTYEYSTIACDSFVLPSESETYFNSGTYYDTLVNSLGGDSILTIHVSLSTSDTVFIEQSICEGDAVYFGGESIVSTGVYSDTLLNQCGQDSLVTLNLSVHMVDATLLTETLCSGDSYWLENTAYSQTGIYADTVSNQYGCDSILELHLTVYTSDTTDLNVTICANESYMLGSSVFTNAGSYTEVLTNQMGCDSLVQLVLEVNPINADTVNVAICDGESHLQGSSVYSNTGTYQDTFSNQFGCDSVMVLNLMVHPVDTTSISASICTGESYSVGGNVYSATGNYEVELLNAYGCDSLVILDLEVNQNSTSSLNEVICSNESYVIGTSVYTSDGSYIDTLLNQYGCDSVVQLELEVLPHSEEAIDTSLCSGESIMVGTSIYTSTGVYYDTLTNTIGCDSIIVTTLDYVEIDTTVLIGNASIASEQVGAEYQWLNCDDLSVIPGATGMYFTPPDFNASYAVEITYNGCVDTSGCTPNPGIGLEEFLEEQIVVSPNPSSELFHINLPESINRVELKLYDNLGRLLYQAEEKGKSMIELDASDYSSGAYNLLIIIEGYQIERKILKQ